MIVPPSVLGGSRALSAVCGGSEVLGPRVGPVLLHLVVGVRMVVGLTVVLAVKESREGEAITVTKVLNIRLRAA